ncbi:MAG: serine/threonine-protein kinase [Myxococcaceae bacterium]|nr:serine/threonine-protein kinase [Myxococcaceae bacterium]
MACLRDHQLQAFAEQLAKKQPVDLQHRDHLRGCARCQAELRRYTITDPETHEVPPGSQEATTALQAPYVPTPLLDDIDRGVAIGRYVVLNKLSQGPMGVVFVAYDPELDRRVALKLLRNDVQGVDDAARRSRFFREAQALARVTHPNVITIFDIGSYGPYAFLAMNFVEGITLAQWLKASPRSADEVLALFEKAGNGLAAAHAANLVHHDVTPHNVLVSNTHEVFVTDFGLARAIDSGAHPPITVPQPALQTDDFPSLQMLGTPRYMAPEQLDGQPVDARGDQFSFCASLFEALFGEVPFPGATVPDIQQRMASNAMHVPASRKHVPQRVWQALVRGLSTHPAARFPSMEALLDALHTVPQNPRKLLYMRAAMAVLGALALGTWAGVAARSLTTQKCQDASARFAAWDDARRKQVRDALGTHKAEYAPETAGKVDAALTRYAEGWAHTFTEACMATRVRKEQPATRFELQTDCLEKRRREFSALVTLLADGQVDISNAVNATQELTPLSVCADGAALEQNASAQGPGTKAVPAALSDALGQVKALYSTGQFAEAQKKASALVAPARAADNAPFAAEALYWLGKLQSQSGELLAAEPILLEASLTAQASHSDQVAVLALSQLGRNTGSGRGLYEEASLYHQQAKALLSRTNDNGELTARLLYDWAASLSAQDRDPEAIGLLEQAVGISNPLQGDANLDTLLYLDALADALRDSKRVDDALGVLQRAKEARVQLFGKSHPQLTSSYYRLAVAYADLNRAAEAEAWFGRALEQIRAVDQKDFISATTFTSYAQFLLRQKNFSAARTMIEKALAQKPGLWLLTPPRSPMSLSQLGDVEQGEGRYDKALALHTQALELKRKTYPKDPRRQARELEGLGQDCVGLKKTERAIAYFEQALAVLPDNIVNCEQRAEVSLQLADLLWSAPKQRTRARALVEQSATSVKPLHASNVRNELDAWLSSHPATSLPH